MLFNFIVKDLSPLGPNSKTYLLWREKKTVQFELSFNFIEFNLTFSIQY